jgi:hypothetical protein
VGAQNVYIYIYFFTDACIEKWATAEQGININGNKNTVTFPAKAAKHIFF